MFGFLPINFRFRKKVSLILDIYHCMLDEKDKAMHPNQIAKKTGIHFGEVAKRLDSTPELFVKLPKRDGLTKYRITTSASARTDEETEEMLGKLAYRESLVLYAFGTMVATMLIIVVLTIIPNL